MALNNLQGLICYKTKPNQTKPNRIYLIYMYKEDLALNNLQWLICHKTKPNQIIYMQYILQLNKNIFLLMTWFGLVLWHISHYRLFNAKSCFYIYIKYMICRYTPLNDKTVLFLTIQFSISQQC